MKRIKISIGAVLFAILMVILFMPIIQQEFKIFNIRKLGGVTEKIEMPDFNIKDFISGKYQSQLEKHISQDFGFKEPVIRTYNQYLWTFYKKTYTTNVAIGKDNYLFEKFAVNEYYKGHLCKFTDSEKLKESFYKQDKRLYQIQSILEEYGKTLFVLMEPGKERVYSEFLPEREGINIENNFYAYDYHKYLFEQFGINHIDINEWFNNIKDTVSYPLFTQSGTHWSNIASVYATDSILRYMQSFSEKPIPQIHIGEMYKDKVRKPDNDLERLYNLCIPFKTEPYYYADVYAIADKNSYKPSFILIGDSFFWNLTYNIPLDSIFSSYRYWYYNSTIYFDDNYRKTKDVDIVEQLLSTDFIILAYNPVQIYDLDRGFISKALIELCYNEEQVNDVLDNIKNAMRETPEWFKNLKNKAEKKGVSIEDVMDNDAQYLLYQNPENYFPELNQDIPESRNIKIESHTNPIEKIKEKMRNNPDWMESIREKAEQRGISLDSMMTNDAIWILRRK